MSSDTEALSIELPNGYVLQNYTITEVMGQGGFGITYLATEKDTERRVVIKENYPAEFSTRDRDSHRAAPAGTKNKENYHWALGSFLNEAKILTRLNHPNIVRVLHTFQALGTAYYVMDHIGGNPLHQAAPQQMTEEWLLSILRPMLSALDYIHSQPEVLLHRDIKPSNILVDPKGTPMLIDFGAARSVISTHTHSKMGTPGYAPHEQWSSSKKCGPWTDLYGLGATCYYLIVGEAPPNCNDRSPDDCYSPLASRPELQGQFSPSLLASIDKALALRIDDRWQSAQEWLDELDAEHRRKQEEERRRKAEAEQQILRELEAEKLKVAAAQAALRTAEEKAKQAETARQAAEEKAKQAEVVPYTAVESNKRTKAERSNRKKSTGFFKYSAIFGGLLLASCLTLGYIGGPKWAAEKNYPTLLRSFLYLPGVDVNKADKDGNTLLHYAAGNSRKECVKLLIAAGADVNKANNSGETPLYWAASWSHTECVKQLIAAGADVNKATNWGSTPLYGAAKFGRKECMKLLITAGADVNKADNWGSTPLDVTRTPDIKRLLREAAEIKPAPKEKADENEPPAMTEQEAAKRRLQQQNITPEKYNTALLEAAEKGNRELIATLLTAGVDVNTANANGNTPLWWAAWNGHTECVKLLIAAKADVNKASNYGWTPLFVAIHFGHTECVKLLIDAGADVNKADENGDTPLYWAAYYGHTECAKQLIAAGADVNMADKDDFSPLHMAAKNGHKECVEQLIAAKADVNKANIRGDTPLYWAAWKGHTECVKLLIEAKADVNKATNSGSTPLCWAALWGHTECVKLLLAAGADVNMADNRGDTPLCWAAKNGHTECVKLLIAAGADVNKAHNIGGTPLHIAKTEEIKRLLREAAEKKPATEQADENEPQAVPEQEAAKSRLQQQNNTPEKYNTALLEAAEKGNSELMSQLLTAGTDVNTADKNGETPLYLAAQNGHKECVKLLIAAGADVNKADKEDRTPLYWAAYYGHKECVKQLIAAKADVNKANKDGWTPLFWAAYYDNKESVELLIAAGADVNKANKHGETPLFWAAYYDNKESVELLIAAGADVNKANNNGFTPLSVAKTEEIKRLLRAAGAR